MNKQIHELQRLSQKYFFSYSLSCSFGIEEGKFYVSSSHISSEAFENLKDTGNTLFAIMLICSFDITQRQQTTPQSKN